MHDKILNPFQACPKLSKPFQGPGEGGGNSLSLNLSKFNQFKVILGKLSLFQEKKDCLFFEAHGLLAYGVLARINSNQPTQIKKQTKSRPMPVKK
ncbi:MAG TPA: hypothetical protein VNU95_05240 [Candidatus Acidoferrales bacterium]|nr:hypothetical protein [Candidatus Acidoferrales bacterium]